MDQLRVNMGELDQLWSDLMGISGTFGNIDAVDKSVADAVGQDDLSSAVMDFGDKWDDRRESIIKSLDTIWQAARAVHSTFQDADGALADVLTNTDS